MKFLFIFIDGVGLGKDDPEVNPFVKALVPNLDSLLEGKKLTAYADPNGRHAKNRLINTQRASLLALDACLGIDGMPQSASGQASLLTGKNVSKILGFHDGPKPNPRIMEILKKGTLFSHIHHNGTKAVFVNAYPPRYFKSIETGYKLPGVIALAASYAGMPLKTMEDLNRGEAISADFTAQGWHDRLGLLDTPILNTTQAGQRLLALSTGFDLAFFEYWITDVAGHQQDMQAACDIVENFDSVLGSLFNSWNDENGLILITSDHGNLEDLSTRKHTRNDVPLLLIGSPGLRDQFIDEMNEMSKSDEFFDLTVVSPAITHLLDNLK